MPVISEWFNWLIAVEICGWCKEIYVFFKYFSDHASSCNSGR